VKDQLLHLVGKNMKNALLSETKNKKVESTVEKELQAKILFLSVKYFSEI